jgi:hypothetical protein
MLACVLVAGRGQADDSGPTLGPPQTVRMQIGVVVKADKGACRGIVATMPVPMDWPEQEVRTVGEETSPHVKKVGFRLVGGTAKQMVVEIPNLPAGEEAKALITLEVARRAISPPAETGVFVLPRKLARDVKEHLNESPYIESRHAKIRALAKEAAADKPAAWQQVKALYDLARAKVQYKFGPLKGGLKALEDGEGDCEDISSLFIALCRASEIPARTVWVPGHCYPEFYLEDQAGRGYWFPCQAAGDRDFGGIPELRPILQKGDNFRVPQQREPQRYVSENLRAADAKGAPSVRFVREIMPR